MNFDDLHDPHPPRPGTAALAAVSRRARQLRRRRAAMVATGAVAAIAAFVVPTALVVTGDGEGERIVPAEPSTTAAPATTTPATPAPTPPPAPPTTVAAPSQQLARGVVAIRADGNAVLVDPDGTETVVYDGADPRVPPAEGDLSAVDSVVATPDGRIFVSTCCEPVPGTWFEVVGGQPPAPEAVAYGHGLALSPDGLRIAAVGAQGITVSDLDRNILASADLSGAATSRQPEAVMWLDDDTLAVIELRPGDGGGSWLYTTDAALVGVPDATGVRLLEGIEFVPRPAGVAADGSILVAPSAAEEPTLLLSAYDPVLLAVRPEADVTLPTPAIDAWYDGSPTWVDADGAVHVGDTELAGAFAWARPIG